VLSRRLISISAAAALAGTVTKTMSPILIMLEISENMEYLEGLIICVLVSNSVGSIYVMSFFDTILNIRK
jgi:H+/Cl- antiporter ClcA